MKRGLSTGDITATGLVDENDSPLTKTRNGRKRSKKAQTFCSQPTQNTCSTADIVADVAGSNQSATPASATVSQK